MEIKDILRNSSELKGSPSESGVSDRWNDEWGFGLLDASCAIDTVLERPCTPLNSGGGGIVVPPSNDTTDEGVTVSNPVNGTWFIAGEIIRIDGSVVNDSGPWDQVDIRITQYLDDFEEVVLLDWSTAGGDIDSWYLDVLIKEDWIDESEQNVVIEVKASGAGELVLSLIHI